MVFEFAKNDNIPIAMALGGGYSKDIDETVEAYVGTYEVARRTYL